MGVTKRQVEQAWVDLGPKYGGVKEDYFGLLYLAEEFKKPPEALARQVAFGGNDYGLDAFHIDTDRRNLYLYQFKWSESHAQFKVSLQRLVDAGMERIFGNPNQDERQNPFLIQLKSDLDENQALIDRVFVHFVFNGDTEAAEQSAVLESLREDLESKKHYLDSYFGRDNVQLSLQYVNNDTRGRSRHARVRTTRQYRIPFHDSLRTSTENGATLHVGLVRLMDLYRMYREMEHRLFSRNIRYGLSADKPPNRAIRQALARIVLQGEDSPSVFLFNHNGVTLSAERVDFEDGWCTVTEPRILNGAQTVTSLVRFLDDNREHPALKGNGKALEEIRVLAKIISDIDDESFVTNVTVCNNRQNPVEPWHLRASDRIQLELQDKFRDDLKIFYERQEGSFKALSDADLEELEIEQQSRAIQIKRLAQTFLAAQGEVTLMSRLPEVFESEKHYQQTFRESYLRSNSRRILLAYKIQFRLNAIIKEIVEKGAQKYYYLGKARNLVWALLVQGVLNHPRLDTWLEQFGESLVIEADYSEALKQIASARVRLILGEALSDERSKSFLAEERYDILRTKATYQRCMDVAFEKYEWKKIPL